MTAPRGESTLECQQCGTVLRTLSPAETQQVAANPYNFVLYCDSCRRSGVTDDFSERLVVGLPGPVLR